MKTEETREREELFPDDDWEEEDDWATAKRQGWTCFVMWWSEEKALSLPSRFLAVRGEGSAPP